MTKYKIGILAYGSLIDNPGKEIKPIISTEWIYKEKILPVVNGVL